jgi:acetylornithine deacetylase/succinyl-diaminopimelate desuccinylase-like protein
LAVTARSPASIDAVLGQVDAGLDQAHARLFDLPRIPSIPVVDQVERVLAIDALLMGFGLDDDQIHGPNEKFEMRSFHRGTRSHALLLGKLAALA